MGGVEKRARKGREGKEGKEERDTFFPLSTASAGSFAKLKSNLKFLAYEA